MKQVLQSLKDGSVRVADVPAPAAAPGQLLIRTRTTLLSAGTERMLLEFGRAGWVSKARQQPDKLRMVLAKARTDGVSATFEAVRSRLDQPVAPGYCNVGRVLETGQDITGFAPGDRVVSNGAHAEIVAVPRNLCARIPDAVTDEAASFTVVAAIGLQGIRLAAPSLGEGVVVTGLGLIGLLTVQMLRAQGCRVLGIDPDPARRALAEGFGAATVDPGSADVLAAAAAFSRGAGIDAVIITAATRSSEPVAQAAAMCRRRGRIVLVGVTGLELNRADFYAKELTFQVSCSYGPGRYDSAYEEGGQDYPFGFVRWTAQRNFEAVLDLMAAGALDVAPLISHRFPIARGEEALALLADDTPSLGILLQYDGTSGEEQIRSRQVRLVQRPAAGRGGIAFLGAGNYAGRVLIPAFRSAGADLRIVVSRRGVSAAHLGRSFGFAAAATDPAAALMADEADAVVIATRHDAHAEQVIAALEAGKHVWCEKPLCLTLDELARIEVVAAERPEQCLTVGFNRRFAPQVVRMKGLLDTVAAPRHFIMTVNAGAVPAGHWVQDPATGGGRIIGEACHFIDLLRHLAGAPILRHEAVALRHGAASPPLSDNATITLGFADGSVGVIHYVANGHRSFPKERLEVFTSGRVLRLDNFRVLRGWGWKGFSRQRLWRQDKGASGAVRAFLAAVREGTPPPIPREEIFEVARRTIEIAECLR